MKCSFLTVFFCQLAIGQSLYSGSLSDTASALYTGYSSSCAAPNFCAYAGSDVVPWGTVPNFSAPGTSGLQNNNASAYDTSYLGHLNADGATYFTNSSYLSPITRVTDAYSIPGRNNRTFTAGIGGSSAFVLTNRDSTLVYIDDNSAGRICFFSPSGANQGHCSAAINYPGTSKPATGVVVTTNMCVTGGTACPASSASTPSDFGSGDFSLTDPAVWYTFGSNEVITTSTVVTPATFNIGDGTYSIGSPIVDFQFGLPLGTTATGTSCTQTGASGTLNNAPCWTASTFYSYGGYVTHRLTSAEMLNGGVWQAGFNYIPGDIVDAGAPSHCMYNVTAVTGTGASGSGTQPLGFITNGACAINIVSDNQVTWRGTYSVPQFVYQNTGKAGISADSAFQWIAAPVKVCPGGLGSNIAVNSQTFVCSSSVFTSSMVGQTVGVPGAGKSGATLYTTIIAQSGTTATLALPALTTVSAGATLSLTGHADTLSSTDGDANGIIWTNVGTNYVPANNQAWVAIGGISRDTTYAVDGGTYSSKYAVAISTNTYGIAPTYAANAQQDTGLWVVEYDAIPNIYHLLNMATGIWTDWTCSGGSGYNCAGGSWGSTVVGTLKALADPFGTGQNCPDTIHNFKLSTNGLFGVVTGTAIYPYSQCSSIQGHNFYSWQPISGFDPYASLQITYGPLPHYGVGANKLVGENTSAWGFGSGVFVPVYNLNNVQGTAASTPGNPVQGGGNPPPFSVYLRTVSNSTPPPSNYPLPQTTPLGCYATTDSTILSPSCDMSDGIGNHVSWAGDPGTDTYPMCGTNYNSATLNPIPFMQWQGMETCYQTYPTYPSGYSGNTTPPSLPLAQSYGNVWQFSHAFGTGTSVTFSTQFMVSQYSQDANWLFWSSDWDCENGSTTGSAPAVYSGNGTYFQTLAVTPVPAGPSSLCGLPWQPALPYVVGNLINPIEGTSGSGGIDDVFQALTSGTTGPPSSLSNNQPECGSVSCFANTNPPTVTAVAVVAATESGNTGTITLPSPGWAVNTGVFVTLSGFSPTGWNGTFPVSSGSGAGLTTLTLSGLASGLAAVTTFGTAAAQGDTVCDNSSGLSDVLNPPLPYASTCSSGVVWQDLGPQTQRGDVFAVNLGNQH